jgi:hypothetical protein
MFTKLLSKFRKSHAPEGLSEETAKDPRPVSDVPIVEGASNQVDTHMIRTVPADVARVQTSGTGVGGATLIQPLRF